MGSGKITGRNVFYINGGLVSEDKTGRKSPGITDRFRHMMKRYFIVDSNGIPQYANSSELGMEKHAKIEVNNLDNPRTIRFTFLSQPSDDEEEAKWFNLLALLIPSDKVFYDFHFHCAFPIRATNLKMLNLTSKVSWLEARSVYNSFVPRYEKFLRNNPSISENVLPNFYTLYAQSVGQENVERLNFLNGKFKTTEDKDAGKYYHNIEASVLLALAGKSEDIIVGQYSDYFSEFAQDANNLLKKSGGQLALDRLASDYNTYVISNDAISLLTTEASKAMMFPFYNEIKFLTDPQCRFSNIISDLGLEKELITQVLGASTVARYGVSSGQYVSSPMEDEPPAEKFRFSSKALRYWDFQGWIEGTIFSGGEFPGIEIGNVLSNFDEGTHLTAVERFWRNQMQLLGLGAAVNSAVEVVRRTLDQMLAGTPSYSETLFYRIQKYNKKGTLLTTYYIPNGPSLDECHFIDTQVKYGLRYKYVITSYVLVVGNSYNYASFGRADGDLRRTTAMIDMGIAPMMRLYELPMGTVSDLAPMDNPPMPPEVLMVPLKNIGNKIMINMNGSTGDVKMQPVIIQPGDKKKFALLKLSQGEKGKKIRFKNDDPPAAFEVFRTTIKPTSYKDFAGKKIRIVSTNNTASAAAYEDKILPNVKYYYVMRSVDFHGNLSNPTPVYEMEMKTKAGPPYMILKIIDFEKEKMANKAPTKTMKRYVQIMPTTSQGLLNTEDSNSPFGLEDIKTVDGVKNLVLGVADEKLWGKKFKIRFTSKKTGRKIDLDVNFSTERQN